MMKRLVFVASMVSLTIAAAYAAWFAPSVSEASVLLIWGGALLVLAHQARPRITTRLEPQPAAGDRALGVRTAKSELPATGSVRLQPGV
jgi:hypothetical protein